MNLLLAVTLFVLGAHSKPVSTGARDPFVPRALPFGDSVFGCTDCPRAIPDNSEGQATTLVIGMTGTVLEVCLEINHTWVGDLTLDLVSPTGEVAHLLARVGHTTPCGGDDMHITILDDCETVLPGSCMDFQQHCDQETDNEPWIADGLNTTGDGLSRLATTFVNDPNGIWTLNFSDSILGDTGTIHDFALVFGPSAGGGGDPHFLSFQGETFDFYGVGDGVYNLLSSETVQINSRFAKTQRADGMVLVDPANNNRAFTLMEEIGIKFKDQTGPRLTVTSTGMALVNGEPMLAEGQKTRTVKWSMGATEMGSITFSLVNETVTQPWGPLQQEVVARAVVTLPDISLEVLVCRLEEVYPGIPFLDFDLKRVSNDLKAGMHGIVGQSVHGTQAERGLANEVFTEGHDSDYVVMGNDLFGDKFTFNRFGQ
mmetsp:Transcript_1257/g.1399  ORF Transcript_1257/g.1399 Transcript_1257/m.1399 type:complete len:427 (+) Transcript_1257:46-1326(+)